MAENKTQMTDASVDQYIDQIEDPVKREDSRAILAMMQAASGVEPRMWGEKIVGFGDAHLKYASGREVDWFLVGFSPRKDTLTLYLSMDVNQNPALLQKLGKYKTGAGCLYIKKLKDVDQDALKALIEQAVEQTRDLEKNPPQKKK